MRNIWVRILAIVGCLAYATSAPAEKRDFATPRKSDCLDVIGKKLETILGLLENMLSPKQSYTVALSQPPPVRVRASIDSTYGQHIELEWDPNQTMKLVRNLTIPGVFNSEENGKSETNIKEKFRRERETWAISFQADPLPISNGDSGSQNYMAVYFSKKIVPLAESLDTTLIMDFSEKVSSVNAQLTQCIETRKRERSTNQGFDLFTILLVKHISCIFNSDSEPERAQCRRDWVAKIIATDPKAKHDHGMNEIMEIFNKAESRILKLRENSQRQKVEVEAHFSKMSSDKPRDSSPFDFVITITPQDLPRMEEAIKRMTALDGATASVRGLSSGVSGVAADVFQILAQIAFDRAKSKSFAILSEKLADFVCEQMRLPYGVADDLLSEDEKAASTRVCKAEQKLIKDSCPREILTAAEVGEFYNEQVCDIPGKETTIKSSCIEAKQKRLICRQNPENKNQWPVLLPQTCQAVRNLRMQELATSGKTVLNALVEDLSFRALNLLEHKNQKNTVIPINELVTKSIFNAINLSKQHANMSASLTSRDVQMLWIEFSNVFLRTVSKYKKSNPGDSKPEQPNDCEETFVKKEDLNNFSCSVKVGLAILAECSNSIGRCDARALTDMIAKPESYFNIHEDPVCQGVFESAGAEQYWPDIRQFVTHGIDVILPPKGSTPPQQLRTAIGLIFDVAERVYSDSILRPTTPPNVRLFGQMLPSLRRLTLGILDRDAQVALLASVKIVELASQLTFDAPEYQGWTWNNHPYIEREDMQRMLRKVAQLVTAVSSYAQNYSADERGDDKQAAAQREARKKAIESLIDQSTDRTNRSGDVIVSLGANVGFYGGGEYQARTAGWGTSYPQLGLPMGIAVQKLPWGTERRSQARTRDHVGFHAQLSLIDLAQFLNYNASGQLGEVHWANFVTLGAQVGMLFGITHRARSAELFNLALDLRYAPSVNFPGSTDGHSSPSGVFRIGLFLGYYVPFFDFN